MAKDSDQVALAARLDPQHTEPVLLVVERDALYQASQGLCGGICAGWQHHGGDLILAPHAAHASRDIDPYPLARASGRQFRVGLWPRHPFEE